MSDQLELPRLLQLYECSQGADHRLVLLQRSDIGDLTEEAPIEHLFQNVEPLAAPDLGKGQGGVPPDVRHRSGAVAGVTFCH